MINIDELKLTERSMFFRDKTPLIMGLKIIDDELRELVDVRFYRTSNSNTVHCAAWITTDTKYAVGVGKAGGVGIHHTSAALSSALHDMGVVLNDYECHGKGDSLMERTLVELGYALGANKCCMVKFER